MNTQQWFCVAILLSLTLSGCIEPQNQQSFDEQEDIVNEFTHQWNGTEEEPLNWEKINTEFNE